MKIINFLLVLMTTSTFYSQKTILINTKHTVLALQTDHDNSLVTTYFGEKLKTNDEYGTIGSLDTFKPGNDDLYNKREAYVASGSLNLLEPALTVTHADGDKSMVLQYVGHEVKNIDGNRTLTSIVLKDPHYDFQATLFYKAYKNEDVIEQWSEIEHHEKKAVELQKYASANLTLSGKGFYLKNHYSGWGREMRSEEQKLPHGLRTLDSKLGTRNNLLLSSSFMVSIDRPATETEGEVIAASLEWTGNFKIDFETFDEYYLRITAGMNNFASDYKLPPGEKFATPKFVYTYSNQGRGTASRNLQNWGRKYQLLDGEGSRYTLLNNWETTYFDFDDQKLKDLIEDTRTLGVDLFLLDDGWFGNKYPRNKANAGLGDWQYNKKKLKNGIGSLVREATDKGVKFGIWLEPEMVNPKSELYENHPDWVIREPGRKEYYMRNQLVLDLANPKVQDFVYNTVDRLFQENPGLAFIKWDCNSLIYNAHSPYLKDQDRFYIEYVRGLYNVMAKLRAKYPKIPIMLCAGGGSRVDYGALQYFTEFWPSDNTDPFDRIFIQWEYSYYFPAIALGCHVTDMGKQSIKFRTDVAMMGKLGFDIRLRELSDNELSFCQNAVKLYDSFKNIIWHGNQYRLQNPYDNKVASVAYINENKSKAVVFNYYMSTTYQTPIAIPIKMQGLDPDKKYRIREVNLYPDTTSPINSDTVYSGDFLMKVGFNPQVNAKRTSVVLEISEVN